MRIFSVLSIVTDLSHSTWLSTSLTKSMNHLCRRKRETLLKGFHQNGLLQQRSLAGRIVSSVDFGLALKRPEGFDTKTGEVGKAAGVVCSEVGDAVGVIRHGEPAVEL